MTYPTVQHNTQDWLQQQTATLQAFTDGLEGDLLDAAVDIVEPALEDIAYTAPPRGNNKFVWSTNPVKNRKAQKW
jgi:hypothetical protein